MPRASHIPGTNSVPHDQGPAVRRYAEHVNHRQINRLAETGTVFPDAVKEGGSPLHASGNSIPAPKRSQSTTWKQFIAAHMAVLAGTDFFTVEVLTWRGLATYYVLFFLHLETRRVSLGGITRHPTETWMEQIARNAIDDGSGHLRHVRYLLHDRDTKFCAAFSTTLATGGVKCIALPARSPNLNAFAERWVRSVKQECLSKLILFGERSLRRAVTEFIEHYHSERNHQGKNNVLLFPLPRYPRDGQQKAVCCKERLGGLLRYYCRAA